MKLCDTFRKLSFETWYKLYSAKTVDMQLGEETITDINLLELKLKHGNEIITKTFTKPKESNTGADWEWWLTGKSKKWLGIRIQAKILNHKTNKYEHLHYYKNNKQKTKKYQSDRLVKSSMSDSIKRIPLYCLYSYWDNLNYNVKWKCGSYPEVIDSYGCSFISAYDVVKLRQGNKCNLSDVLDYMIPWHCIICCKGFGGDDLPSRALNTIMELTKISSIVENPKNKPKFKLYDEPPEYVKLLLSNDLTELTDEHLRTITIINENSNE